MIHRFVIMGVSGCGKSSIGTAFATKIGAEFMDGDDLHPASNLAKMTAGIPLTDDDRAPWLLRVGQALQGSVGTKVIGCSALKRRYRDIIRHHAQGPVMFLYLAGSYDVLAERMMSRTGHFMPLSLLKTQFAALEPPSPDEISVTVNVDQTPKAVLTELLHKINFLHE